MYAGHAKTVRSGQDGAPQREDGTTGLLRDHLGVMPGQASWPSEGLHQGFLGGKASSQRGQQTGRLISGEEPIAKARSPLHRQTESLDVHHVDTHSNDAHLPTAIRP